MLHIFCKIDKPIKFLQRGNSFATSVHPNVSMYNNKMMYRMCFILWNCRNFKLMIQIQWYYRRTVFDLLLLFILIFIHIHIYKYNMHLHRIMAIFHARYDNFTSYNLALFVWLRKRCTFYCMFSSHKTLIFHLLSYTSCT